MARSGAATIVDIPLRGPRGEPVDLWRTIMSHGIAHLPPARLDEDGRRLEVTLRVSAMGARRVMVSPRGKKARIEILGRAPGPRSLDLVVDQVRHVLRLDADLGGFYELAVADPDLGWAVSGAGRMLRGPSVFEDVVKTICTTNCAWSATERMVGAIVEHLGTRAPGAPRTGPYGRAFPAPATMASAGEDFYRDVARAGYRGRYLIELSTAVAGGDVDLEGLATATPGELSDDELEAVLLALPGVGPYAAAHIMMMLGRYSRLILDSWTRPKYARLRGRKTVTDTAIERRFRRFGPYAGLAFWLYLTRDWVTDTA